MSDEKSTGTPPDLGRIVSLIMENPGLVAEIANLASADGKKSDEPDALKSPTQAPGERAVSESVSRLSPSTDSRIQAREQLLTALRPYLSKERARAIDSMISVVQIIDMMKAR